MKITYQTLLLTGTRAISFAGKKEDTTPVAIPVQAQAVTSLAADATTGVNPTSPMGS
ncbi:hypothetical protein [Fibrella arboris]|uniref:hypothetical protein n=1 Tax=Fibrella arboris TaxID=3242486 RepID=UPI00352124CA